MPEINTHEPYTFFFYSNEGELSLPPNVFVRAQGQEAEFLISNDKEPVLFLKRSVGFSSDELYELHGLLNSNLSKIRADWTYAFT
jgi:hypothetical protein